MSNNTERIVILDHDRHIVYFEDIDMDVVNKKYNGEEEEYIKDNYDLSGYWTWDYIVSQVTNYPGLKTI